ncbi:MAG: hypothetical protein WCJ04_01060 [Actinomycetes bacterium]
MRPARTTFRTVILVAACALALSSCGGTVREPREYGDVTTDGKGYYGNLMYGCTGVEPTDGKYVNVKLESVNYCNCIFNGLKETVPFSDAKAFDQYQATAKAGEIKIPKNIQTVQQKCGKSN